MGVAIPYLGRRHVVNSTWISSKKTALVYKEKVAIARVAATPTVPILSCPPDSSHMPGTSDVGALQKACV